MMDALLGGSYPAFDSRELHCVCVCVCVFSDVRLILQRRTSFLTKSQSIVVVVVEKHDDGKGRG